MPLIDFSLRTLALNTNDEFPEGMNFDGSFTLQKDIRDLPPDNAEFFIKHIYVDGGGQVPAHRRKEPVVWVGVELPEMSDEIISRDDVSTQVTSTRFNGDATPHLNNRGVLRFPITMYPVDGWHNVDDLGIYDGARDYSSNITSRQNIVANAPRHYEAKGTHSCNIPIGKMRLDDHTIRIKLTPYAVDGDITSETTSTTDQKVRIRYIQVILEYK